MNERYEEKNLSPVTQKYVDADLSLNNLFHSNVRPSRVRSVLIDLMQTFAERKNVADLLRDYENDRFSTPSHLPQRELLHLSTLIYEHVPISYKDVELSPVSPLGTSSVLTEVSQKSILSTVRNVEILADPTTQLALETARMQREIRKETSSSNFVTDFCTSARCVRCQVFPTESGFIPHFQVFAMSSGGISSSGEMDYKIVEHARTYLDFLYRVQGLTSLYSIDKVKIEFANVNITEALIRKMSLDRRELGRHSQDNGFDFFKTYGIGLPNSVSSFDELDDEKVREYEIQGYVKSLRNLSQKITSLAKKHQDVTFGYDLSRIAGIGYYNGHCFKISASNARGEEYPLADGGYANWLGTLLSNRRIQYFSSGFGLELLGNQFRAG